MAMTVLSGHLLSASLRLTDIGLFTLLALALFACLLYRRYWLTFIPVVLCAITRPEGFVFSFAFFLSGAGCLTLSLFMMVTTETQHRARYFLFYGIAGALFFLITLLINHALTGHFQFMSVANKGYFKAFPLSGAILHTMSDALAILKGVFFGQSGGARQFYLLPGIAGFLGLTGVLLFKREQRETQLAECWLLLSAGASILLIASSQFQGVSNDRYLGWLLPLWLIYIAVGTYELNERLGSRSFLPIMTAMLVLYQCSSLALVATDAYTVAVEIEKERAFTDQIKKTIPPTKTFGSASSVYLSYYLSDHTIYNLWGITSPGFFHPESNQQLERIIDRIKHREDLQFDYWLSFMNFADTYEWAAPFIGETLAVDNASALAGKMAYAVFETNWETIEGGDIPVLLTNRIENLTLIDSIDVGYLTDESKHHYEYKLRLKNARIPIIAKTADLGGKMYSEAGRIVIGSESFVASGVTPGRDLWIVLRTSRTASGTMFLGQQKSKIENFEVNDQLELRLFMDDTEVSVPSLPLKDDGFSEVLMKIPGADIHSDRQTITIVGDHISYAYWFYQ